MTQFGRPGMSPIEKQEVWFFWKKGESLSEIGRATNRHPGSIFTFLKLYGGIEPQKRYRSKRVLTLFEREEISRGIAANFSMREISRKLNRAPSTIYREIKRNGGLLKYRAIKADNKAWENAKRPKLCYLSKNNLLKTLIEQKILIKWSPQQISGWLKRTYSENKSMQISHETIYKSLFIQAKGIFKKELTRQLRSKRVMRQSKKGNVKKFVRGQIIDAISIRERPPSVEDRAIPGHWEGDLIAGSKNTHIATLVERQSRFTLLIKIDGKDTKTVVSALIERVKKLPINLCKTLTWDRGSELASHKKFTVATNMKVYFCDPRSPWQRGTNENTNRLIRQYFPKKTDLSIHSQERLNEVALELNERPRKTLNFKAPIEKLYEVLH